MTRDPIRLQGDYEPHPEAPSATQWRAVLARALALSCFLSLGVATVGAAMAPLSLVPQLSFAAAIVLMLGACWASEGGDHA